MKHHKRKRAPSSSSSSASYNPAAERLKERWKKLDKQALIATVLWFFGAFGVYTLLNYFEMTFHWYLYPLLIAALAIGYMVLNGGTFDKNADLDPSRFPAKWDEARRQRETEAFYRRRAIAKKLLPPLFGIGMTLCIDLIYLNLVEL